MPVLRVIVRRSSRADAAGRHTLIVVADGRRRIFRLKVTPRCRRCSAYFGFDSSAFFRLCASPSRE